MVTYNAIFDYSAKIYQLCGHAISTFKTGIRKYPVWIIFN